MNDVLSTPPLQTLVETSRTTCEQHLHSGVINFFKKSHQKLTDTTTPTEGGQDLLTKVPSHGIIKHKPKQHFFVPKHQLGSRKLCNGGRIQLGCKMSYKIQVI